ncbi:tail assembly protein [Acinetobacter stercoris]|uniref:Bacteriophage lambda tail assembly protein I n=1 Tax=Acinetobacter stercoris TaxID=2126983 RepID=A0A2U3MUN4_9GAMM|nr:tail assembly protein [Acinetobacter stercoris]SPL69136.1 Bacteriophage lambda tail assembly protein I [Acinetobacter stercoris]
MLKSVKLYGVLAEKFGSEFKLAVDSPKEAIRALSVQLPGFEKFLRHAHEMGLCFALFIGGQKRGRGKKAPAIYDPVTKRQIYGHNIGEAELGMLTDESVIKIIPRVIGAGGNGLLQTILGAAMVAVGVFTGQVYLIGAGAGMIMGGVAQMLMPKISIEDQNQDGNKANKGFGGAVTTVAQGNPIPVLIGEREIGGFILAGNQYPEDLL